MIEIYKPENTEYTESDRMHVNYEFKRCVECFYDSPGG